MSVKSSSSSSSKSIKQPEFEFISVTELSLRQPTTTTASRVSTSRLSSVSLEDVNSALLKVEKVTDQWLALLSKVFWEGGSTFDAWLNAASAQIAQVLLTFPHSFAQTGLTSGISFMILYGAMGCWSSYTITWLYSDYRKQKEIQNVSFQNHKIQWYEVLDDLLGHRWKSAGFIFNSSLLFCTATIQLIACGSTVYYIDDSLDKLSWTLIFGACCSLSVFIPSAHNYRMWSFGGIVMTSYTAWYLTIASLTIKKETLVSYQGPLNVQQYFIGATNVLYAFGGHAVTVEIMDAMWKPQKYKTVYLYAILYIIMLVLPSATAVYLTFGDKMLTNPNAFAVLPRTKFRDTAVVLMVIHQFIEFGLLALPIYLIWEKLLGVHEKKRYMFKVLARVPVLLAMWFVAVMFPFFGSINSTVGSILTSFSIYLIPCAAHMVYYWSPSSRTNSTEKPPFWIRGSWAGVYCLNLGTVVWVLIVGAGFGGWSSIQNMKKDIHTFGLFAKCYKC